LKAAFPNNPYSFRQNLEFLESALLALVLAAFLAGGIDTVVVVGVLIVKFAWDTVRLW